MDVLICGAGVIGQIYGGRLARAGHRVSLLARGGPARSLAEHGVTLRKDGESWQVRPSVLTAVPDGASFDVALVTVRRDQVAGIVPLLADIRADRVVFLVNHFVELEDLRARTGAGRTLFGFPGVAGFRSDEATVTYLEVAQQKTTVERRDGREQPVVDLLRSAGLAVAVSADMAGWLATHAVFITAVGAAILASGGDSAVLAADPARVADMVAAVDEGFRALSRRHVTVTPAALRIIFTVVPRFVAVPYWQRQLSGPTGTVAIAPHMRATRDSELPALMDDVRQLVAGYGPTPHLDRLLAIPQRIPETDVSDPRTCDP